MFTGSVVEVAEDCRTPSSSLWVTAGAWGVLGRATRFGHPDEAWELRMGARRVVVPRWALVRRGAESSLRGGRWRL